MISSVLSSLLALSSAGSVLAHSLANTATLRVATFNIRCPSDKAPNDWESRIPRIKTVLEKYQPVLIGLQEATLKQIEAIIDQSDWGYIGKGRTDGVAEGEFSCIFYRKSQFECLEQQTFWLSETPEVPGSRSWDTGCTRVCTWGRFQERGSGRQLIFVNTHLDHRSLEARENGAKLIKQRIAGIQGDLPVILTGDFNAFPDEASVQLLRSTYKDCVDSSQTAPVGPTGTYHAYDPTEEKLNRPPIDYILVSQNVAVHSCQTITDQMDGLYPSDHFPVLAEITLPKHPAP